MVRLISILIGLNDRGVIYQTISSVKCIRSMKIIGRSDWDPLDDDIMTSFDHLSIYNIFSTIETVPSSSIKLSAQSQATPHDSSTVTAILQTADNT